jgi:hypothetical protein
MSKAHKIEHNKDKVTAARAQFRRIKAVPCTVDRLECKDDLVVNHLRNKGLSVDRESYALFAYLKDYSELSWEEKQDCKRAAYLASIQ